MCHPPINLKWMSSLNITLITILKIISIFCHSILDPPMAHMMSYVTSGYLFNLTCTSLDYKNFEPYLTSTAKCLVFKTRDMHKPKSNPNCAGDMVLYIAYCLSYTDIDFNNSFYPGILESQWIKLQVSKNEPRIIGNIYMPISYPQANTTIFL